MGLAVTAALFGISWLLDRGTKVPFARLSMILASSGWAAWDSTRVQLDRHESQLSNGPVMLFCMCAMLWPLCFP